MTDFLQHVGVEVEVGVFAEVAPAEGSLQGVTVLDAEFSPDDDPRCRLFRLLDGEGTIVEVECICLLLEDVGENSFFVFVVLWYGVSIYSLFYKSRDSYLL